MRSENKEHDLLPRKEISLFYICKMILRTYYSATMKENIFRSGNLYSLLSLEKNIFFLSNAPFFILVISFLTI